MTVDAGSLPLGAWSNLYLLTSAAAATLVGLLFVVITLAAERRPASDAKRIHIYLTPPVVYFAAVLLLAGALTFPTQSRLTAALCCCAGGAVGALYALSLLRAPLRERFLARADAWHYALLPAGAFGLLVGGGALIYASDPGAGLTTAGVAMLALLALGLRNSWAIAVSVILPSSQDGDANGRDG